MSQTLTRPVHWQTPAILLLALAGVFAFIAPSYVMHYRIPIPAAAGIYACFFLLLVLLVAPAVQGLRLPARFRSIILFLAWCLPYLAYTAGTHDFRWLAFGRLTATSAILLLIYELVPVRRLDRFAWQDLAVATWLIFVLLSHQLSGIWRVPANLDFMGRLYLIAIGAGAWVFVRPVPDLGYRFSFSGETLRAAAINFALFALIAIPSSLALHFTQWNPKFHILQFLLDYLEIFLFIALLEELFFRGFLQTLLSNTLGSSLVGQIFVSCLFGLFHILHAPFPNWRYVLLATVAGWFYGSAFRQGGNLMASALTHAMVDTLWRTLFQKF